MSHIAKTGNKAQVLICSQSNIMMAFGAMRITGAAHGKKTDNIISYHNGTSMKIQLKNSDTMSESTRGHSVDRRSWFEFVRPLKSLSLRAALREITQKKKRVKGESWVGDIFTQACSSRAESELIVRRALLGDDPDFAPTHFVATRLNSAKTEIISVSVCSTNTLLEHLVSTLYEHPRLVKSCIELSPHIYLQRKGGDKNDTRASDIQTKVKFDASLSHLFTPLPLPESTPSQPEPATE